ncbi:DUF4277 domain-containing protein [Endozoicomonas atrinae]|uniref:DUF4277 domain-containing protein n=1 Tax=Endozoicomonas atrinae TaxID=1333660 RepID=UPI003B0038F4
MPPFQYQFKSLNHLGLVAAMCRELKIAEYIDARITNDSDVRNVSIGQAVVAMIINGLGFSGQTLYMFPDFYEDKPIDRLIGEGIQADHLNDKILGRATAFTTLASVTCICTLLLRSLIISSCPARH